MHSKPNSVCQWAAQTVRFRPCDQPLMKVRLHAGSVKLCFHPHRPSITRGHCATHHAERTLNSKCHHYCPLKNWYDGAWNKTHTVNINQSEAAGFDLWKNLADKVAGQTCWNILSYSWIIMRNQCKFFPRIVNRYATAVHLPSTNAYQRIWQQRDTACVGCYCP